MNELIINYIELKGYRRFLTKKVKFLRYDLKEDLQVVIGGNGFGKSSLFFELSPNPAVRKDFLKDGYKKISITFNNVDYLLISSFSKGNHHEFLREGVELNDGHTINVQKKLVEDIFKYDTIIHELLIGRIKFTDMSPSSRKEWLARLSPSTVDYAAKIHREMEVELRNLKGARINADAKLVEVGSSIIDQADIDIMHQNIEAFRSEIDFLYSKKFETDPCTPEEVRFLKEFNLNRSRVESDFKRLEAIKPEGTHVDETYFNAKQVERDAVMMRKTQLESTKTSLEDNYHSLEDIVKDVDFGEERCSNDVRATIGEMVARLESMPKVSDGMHSVHDVDMVLSTLRDLGVYDTLLDIFQTMVPNPDMTIYSGERHAFHEAKIDGLRMELMSFNNQLTFAQDKLKEADKMPVADCPECSHRFTLTNDVHNPPKIKAFMVEVAGKIEAVEATITEHQTALKEQKLWLGKMSQYRDVEAQYTVLNPFFELVTNDDNLLDNPKRLSYLLNDFVRDLEALKEYRSLDVKIVQEKALLERLERAEKQSTEKLTAQMGLLEKRIEKLTDELYETSVELRDIDKYIDYYSKATRLVAQYTKMVEDWQAFSLKHVKTKTNDILSAEIAEKSRLAGEIHRDIVESSSKLSVKEHLVSNLEEIVRDSEITKVLVDALSPTNGVVADVLMGFILKFTEQMNDVKSMFWTTELKILPCEITNSGLDYKFKLQSTSQDYLTEDVKKGSEGEQELVNFLFVMIARLYLGYVKYPLFLDEVGARFHESNRARLYAYIKQLMESKYVNQVLAISHFESTYNALSHAQINVLDPTGVLVTPDANKHLILTEPS